MARTKEKPQSLSAYFRQLFTENPDWLDGPSNAAVMERWKADHPGKEWAKNVQQGMANVKSKMRKELGWGGRRPRPGDGGPRHGAREAGEGRVRPSALRARPRAGPGSETAMSDASRRRLLELFKARAFSFGRFTLASGKESTYYINSKKALFNSEAVALLGEVLWEATRDLNVQAAVGLEVGAIPMAVAMAARYQREGRPLEGFFVRKQ